ncbi:hypothetical protein NMY22_g2269 [Coprinellus aureogranulatus]|nr:hypothetical protein NMY22_g2269 [Coprinellus aureogranulatus]
MASTNPIVAALKKGVLNAVTPNVCHGSIPLDQKEGALFYKKDTSSDYIDFAARTANDEDIQRLVQECEQATFGRNNQDVLDESYRKAWKMDTSQFATQFDLAKSGILDVVHDQLLHYEENTKNLVAHLYKLNVYGPGSFFKPHIDTPRGDKLFATLVIVLPTVHVGGNLLLGEKGELLNFDSAKKVYDPESNAPLIAFTAFYSDIEHEVLPVESGYRITLTYNLYFTEFDGPSMLKTLSSDSLNSLMVSFANTIASPTVLPRGGALGFGLLYRYPVDRTKSSLEAFTGALKGNDALIRTVCKLLGLETSVKVLYESDSEEHKYLGDLVKNNEAFDDPYGERGSQRDAFEEIGGKVVASPERITSSSRKLPILWVTPPSRMTTADFSYIGYGNEAWLGHVYGDLVLVAQVPAYRERTKYLQENFPSNLPQQILADIEKALQDLPEQNDENAMEESSGDEY